MKASIHFVVDEVNGKHSAQEIKRALAVLPGVLSVSVNDKTERVTVDYDTTGEAQHHILRKLQELGYEVSSQRRDTFPM